MPRQSPTPAIQVMIVDDHAMFREAMRLALSQHPGLSVPYEAGSGEEALARLEDWRPDVILMDISLPGINGIETTRRLLASRSLPVIALSMHETRAYKVAAKEAGARAYALKAGPLEHLVGLIQRVVAEDRRARD